MEGFSVRTTLNRPDWNALTAAAGVRLTSTRQAKTNLYTRGAPVMIWLAAVAAIVFMLMSEPPLVRPMGFAIMCLIFFGTWWVQYWLQRRLHVPDDSGAFLGPHEFDFEPRGFRSRRFNSDAFNQWSLVKDITHSDEHVFLWIDAFSGYVIPGRDLPPHLTAPAAASRLREFLTSASNEPRIEIEATSPPAADLAAQSGSSTPKEPIRPSVAQELTALLRLNAWAMVDGARLYGRDLTIALLGVFSFVLWAGLDRLNFTGEVELFWYTISETGVLVLAVLLIGWLLSRLSRPRVELRQSLLILLGFLPSFVAGIWLAMKLPKIGAIVAAVLLMAWADRYLVAGMRSLTGKRQQFAVSSVLGLTLLMFYVSLQLYFSPGIWFEREPDAEQTAESRREDEQLVFEQSARLNAAIDQLAPRNAGTPNAFFVGFAGYGAQRVFAEEIGLAAMRIGKRYGAVDRTLLLVNDARDNDKHPIATVPSLRHSLNAIAKRMNLEEDVLFLSLSSHGSENATISVSSDLGYWRDLSADDLTDMLRESGIRWKVVVISACHAGSFIDALRDENSIILTAAAAERTSFGCSDDSDLTYFGEAFYRDALPEAATLRDAFQAAREVLRKREVAEARIPSDPQAHFGAALEKKLAAIEATRAND